MSERPSPRLMGAVGAMILVPWIVLAMLPFVATWGPWPRPGGGDRFNAMLARFGVFGDMFGAVNALFSALALWGVFYAVLLQRQEVAAAEEQLRLAKESAKGEEESRRNSERMQA